MLSWIEFGQVAAERDDLLGEYFFDTGVLDSVSASGSNFLVLGRKGAGKTAVFLQFDKNYEKYLSEGDCSVALSLDNYDWSVHELLSNPAKAPALAFIESWKFFIYVQTVRLIEEVGFGSIHTKKLNKILKKIYGSPVPTLVDLVGGKILQLSRLKLPSGGVTISERDLEGLSVSGGEVEFGDVKSDPSMQSKLSSNVGNLVQTFEIELLAHFENSGRAFVSFDRVDEAWVDGSIETIKPMIGGLVSAADSITQKFGGKLRPVLFLREDIFSHLSVNDKNKLRSDCGQLLAWQANSLNRVIMERVNFFSKRAGVSGPQSVNDLFDKEKMRQQRAPFDYLLLRTMMRPRDLIKFLQLVRSDMIDRRDNPFEGEDVNLEKLECKAIYNAEPLYSEWLKEEIIDEWQAQFPQINTILDSLSAIGSTTFSFLEFQNALKRQGLDLIEVDARKYMKFMFDNSIIGFKVGKSQLWRFRCFHPSQGFLDVETYKVHDGLTRALNLKETRA
ncbi:hypothetical protein H0I76_16575 [Limibaculum sp. M0105]|uniref:ATPase n=1 Tax=Thermohalobaculum xanthum TaxID=2753746 RepID=A0A8J7SER1_9RHOB|nr:hypothetical protein [Thermohalobaculum xanthum]MBK0400817.1 hypothetical protein [Thermohalobaculum xanthum]